jgi:hypothetical protein
VLLIAASILAARKLTDYDPVRRVPVTMSAIADAIKWAEETMREIDSRWPIGYIIQFRLPYDGFYKEGTTNASVLKYFLFGGVKRLDLVAEFFNLFNSANISQINAGSGLTPIPGFRQPVAGTGVHQIQFSLDFEPPKPKPHRR